MFNSKAIKICCVNGTKTLLANAVSTFLVKGKLTFINGEKSLPNVQVVSQLYNLR